jgi:hypothetical protein
MRTSSFVGMAIAHNGGSSDVGAGSGGRGSSKSVKPGALSLVEGLSIGLAGENLGVSSR